QHLSLARDVRRVYRAVRHGNRGPRRDASSLDRRGRGVSFEWRSGGGEAGEIMTGIAPPATDPPGALVRGPDAPTTTETMTVAASRLLANGVSCFVGIGLPSVAANLARLTHAPDIL